MSNWQKFKGKDGAQGIDVANMGIPVTGTFGCQICHEAVDDALYYQVARVLRWKCSQGHISLIEKFDL